MAAEEPLYNELHGWFSPTQFKLQNNRCIDSNKHLYYFNVENKVVEVTMVTNSKHHGTMFNDIRYIGKLKRFYKQVNM